MAKKNGGRNGFPCGGKYRVVRECLQCGYEFSPSNPKQKYCSKSCQNKARGKRKERYYSSIRKDTEFAWED